MTDHNININFPDMQGGGRGGSYQQNNQQNNNFYQQNSQRNASFNQYNFNGASSQFMNQVLTNLNNAINRLNTTIGNMNTGGGGNQPPNRVPSGSTGDIWDKVGKTIGLSIASVVGMTLKRFLDIEATSIMARATSSGQFMASAIKGNANESFGGYVNSLFQTEKAKQQAQTSAIAGIGGGAVGAILGAVATPFTAGLVNPVTGAGAGAFLGNAFGNYISAEDRAKIERKQQIQGALAERAAMASISEWKTGFSRFGLARTNREIVPAGLTDNGRAINVPLSQSFENQYGKSQNFNAILNGIVPNLQTQPLDMQKTGDLNKVSQNFLKAGFAVSDFAKLTMQSTQYQAVTGKNIQQFSEDVKEARSKFGDTFDVSSMQTSLNLMTLGYTKSQAQNLAFQSQYNPSSISSVDQFMSQSVGDFYKNKAIGGLIGLDINKSLSTGHAVETRKGAIEKLRSQLATYAQGETAPSNELMYFMQTGDNKRLASLLQNQVTPISGAINEATSQSPAQDRATSEIMDVLRNGLSNVQNMNVNAANVIINNKGGGTGLGLTPPMDYRQSMMSPNVFPMDNSPTKK